MPIHGIINSQITSLQTTSPEVRTVVDSDSANTFVNVIVKNKDTTNATLFTGARTNVTDFTTPETAGTNISFNSEATRTYPGSVGQTLYIRARAQATGKDISFVVTPDPSFVTLPKLRMETPTITRPTNTTDTQTYQITNLGPGTGRIFYRFRRQADSSWGSFIDAGTRSELGFFQFSVSDPWSEESIRIQAFITDDTNVRRESVTNEQTFVAPKRTAPNPSINATLIEKGTRNLEVRFNNQYGATANLFQTLNTEVSRSAPEDPNNEFTGWVFASGNTEANDEIDFNFTNLEPNQTYTIRARNTGTNVDTSLTITRNFSTESLPLTAAPTFESVSETETSISFRIRNNEENGNVTVRYDIGQNPDSESATVNLNPNGQNGDLSAILTFDDLDFGTEYSIRADAIRTDDTKARSTVATQKVETLTPQTATPSIIITGRTATSVTASLKNEDSASATITYRVGDGTETTTSSLNSGSSTTVTVSGLAQSTDLILFAKADATNKTTSEEAEAPFKTKLTIRARSAGVSSVGVQIMGTSYTLTNNPLQQIRQEDGPINVSLSAPASVVEGGITYNFLEWFNLSTNTTISGGRNTSISNVDGPLDIEVRYFLGGF